jgi:hypothetical protein
MKLLKTISILILSTCITFQVSSNEMPEYINSAVEVAIKNVKTLLKVPYSAKFSEVYVIHKFEYSYEKKRIEDKSFTDISDLIYVCGLVNYKNEYGAYSGNTVFYDNSSSFEVLKHDVEEFELTMFKIIYDSACKKTDDDKVYMINIH